MVFRLLVLAINAWSLPAMSREESNAVWPVWFLFATLCGLAFFGWLTTIRSRKNVIWSAPYSWYEPFWPMAKYPLRFLLLGAYAFTLGGVLSILEDIVLNGRHMAVSGAFLFMGLFILAALKLWIRIFRPT